MFKLFYIQIKLHSVSIILLGSLPHPPFRTHLLLPELYRNTPSIGLFSRIFVHLIICLPCRLLAVQWSALCFITFMFGNIPLCLLFYPQFPIIIAVSTCLLLRLLVRLRALWKARNAYTARHPFLAKSLRNLCLFLSFILL